MLHVLGFSSYFYDKFKDPATGNIYTDKSRVLFNSSFLGILNLILFIKKKLKFY